MKRISLVVFPLLLFFLMAVVALPRPADRLDLTVHEWGTFTSVAGADGTAIPWRTYQGTDDLPAFVHQFGGFKFQIPGLVRMETPVLYFYGSHETTADVNVQFPKGTITEWYPKQTRQWSNSSIEWHNVRVSPGIAPDFPGTPDRSHYYAARETDAAPLQVGNEKEKFLFYRGVASFPLPVSAEATEDGRVVMKPVDSDSLQGVILFENRAGKSRYAFVGDMNHEITIDRRSLQGDKAGLLAELERALVAQGLYEKEARAMIKTWGDSWFEEGTRLFYIVPKKVIDSVLPLTVQPAPIETTRVFVGRMEIITPEIQEDVRQAFASNDRATLEKYGRFLEPIKQRIGVK
jgi:hypothetical protein